MIYGYLRTYIPPFKGQYHVSPSGLLSRRLSLFPSPSVEVEELELIAYRYRDIFRPSFSLPPLYVSPIRIIDHRS